VQNRHRLVHGRHDRRSGLGGRSNRHATTALFRKLRDHVTLMRFQAAELVLDIDPSLAAKVEQVFALHIQFTRQGVNTDFL
jgi:hypothetical protein